MTKLNSRQVAERVSLLRRGATAPPTTAGTFPQMLTDLDRLYAPHAGSPLALVLAAVIPRRGGAKGRAG